MCIYLSVRWCFCLNLADVETELKGEDEKKKKKKGYQDWRLPLRCDSGSEGHPGDDSGALSLFLSLYLAYLRTLG